MARPAVAKGFAVGQRLVPAGDSKSAAASKKALRPGKSAAAKQKWCGQAKMVRPSIKAAARKKRCGQAKIFKVFWFVTGVLPGKKML